MFFGVHYGEEPGFVSRFDSNSLTPEQIADTTLFRESELNLNHVNVVYRESLGEQRLFTKESILR